MRPDLSKLKSARRVADPEEILRLVSDADKKFREGGRFLNQTSVELDEEGKVKVNKLIQASVDREPLPTAEELQALAEKVGIEWKDGYADRVIPYFGSDERVDRHGDIVLQNWVFDEFAKNPVVPYSHDWDMPPVGNSIQWKIIDRKDDDYEGPALHLLNLFADEEVWAFADTVFRLVKSGFLKTSSVGFYPGVIIDVQDEEEREELGLGRYGYVYDQNILIEHSPTTVPANVGAISLLRSARMKGMLKPHDVLALRELDRREVQRGAGDLKFWLEREAKWITIWNSIFPETRLEVHRELDEPIPLIVERRAEDDTLVRLAALEEKVAGLTREEPEPDPVQNAALEELIGKTETIIQGKVA